MKKLLLILCMLTAFTAISQIRVAESKTEDVFTTRMGAIKLTKFTIDTNIHYALYFRNAEYTYVTDYQYISFGNAQEVKDFFVLVSKTLETDQDYTLMVGDQTVFISKSVGGTAYISNTRGFFYINKKEVEKLNKVL